MNTDLMFSKNSNNWETPKELYDKLNQEFNFTFDPCPLNSSFDGLNIEWNGSIFINPPYSNIKAFLEKGINEFKEGRATTLVYLIPARTDTRFFHDLIYNRAEIRFIKGRLKFKGFNKEGKQVNNSAPFPSMIVIFRTFTK